MLNVMEPLCSTSPPSSDPIASLEARKPDCAGQSPPPSGNAGDADHQRGDRSSPAAETASNCDTSHTAENGVDIECSADVRSPVTRTPPAPTAKGESVPGSEVKDADVVDGATGKRDAAGDLLTSELDSVGTVSREGSVAPETVRSAFSETSDSLVLELSESDGGADTTESAAPEVEVPGAEEEVLLAEGADEAAAADKGQEDSLLAEGELENQEDSLLAEDEKQDSLLTGDEEGKQDDSVLTKGDSGKREDSLLAEGEQEKQEDTLLAEGEQKDSVLAEREEEKENTEKQQDPSDDSEPAAPSGADVGDEEAGHADPVELPDDLFESAAALQAEEEEKERLRRESNRRLLEQLPDDSSDSPPTSVPLIGEDSDSRFDADDPDSRLDGEDSDSRMGGDLDEDDESRDAGMVNLDEESQDDSEFCVDGDSQDDVEMNDGEESRDACEEDSRDGTDLNMDADSAMDDCNTKEATASMDVSDSVDSPEMSATEDSTDATVMNGCEDTEDIQEDAVDVPEDTADVPDDSIEVAEDGLEDPVDSKTVAEDSTDVNEGEADLSEVKDDGSDAVCSTDKPSDAADSSSSAGAVPVADTKPSEPAESSASKPKSPAPNTDSDTIPEPSGTQGTSHVSPETEARKGQKRPSSPSRSPAPAGVKSRRLNEDKPWVGPSAAVMPARPTRPFIEVKKVQLSQDKMRLLQESKERRLQLASAVAAAAPAGVVDSTSDTSRQVKHPADVTAAKNSTATAAASAAAIKRLKSPILDSMKHMSREQLESLVLQKMCEAIASRSVIGEMKKSAEKHVVAAERFQKKITHLQKQVGDLHLVVKKLSNELKARRSLSYPVKITRTVGLQVTLSKNLPPLTASGRPNKGALAAAAAAARQIQPPNGLLRAQLNAPPVKSQSTSTASRTTTTTTTVGTIGTFTAQQREQMVRAAAASPTTTPPRASPATSPTVGRSSPHQQLMQRRTPTHTTVNRLGRPPSVVSQARTPPRTVTAATGSGPPTQRVLFTSAPASTPGAQGSAVGQGVRVQLQQHLQRSGSLNTTPPRSRTSSQSGGGAGTAADIVDLTDDEPGPSAGGSGSSPRARGLISVRRPDTINQSLSGQNPATTAGMLLISPTGSNPSLIIRSQPTTGGAVTGSAAARALVQQLPVVQRHAALRHPAPFPPTPANPIVNTGQLLPPPPILKVNRKANGIVLSWTMDLTARHANIVSYHLFAYQETGPVNTRSNPWKKVGDVKALPLPMACTLTQFQEGHKYHFAVRAEDSFRRRGPFSNPSSIALLGK